MTSERLSTVVLLAAIAALFLAACGDSGAGASGLPRLEPTMTSLPPSTPTDIPAPDPITLPAVDWENVDQFRAAMRPAFADDVDGFVNRNRYYIEASLEFENDVAIIRGAERVRYTNRSADTLDEIVFRLYANMASLGGRMLIYRAEINGQPVEPGLTARDTVLILPLETPLEPGGSVEITLEFSVAAERGMHASYGAFGFQKEVFSGPEWYPMLSVYEEGDGWWVGVPSTQGDAGYSETGLYEIYLTTPEDFIVVMSGSEIDSFASGEGVITHHYVSGPMRDSLLVASPVFGVLTEYVDDIAVNVYYWPGDEPGAEEALRIAVDSVRIMTRALDATLMPSLTWLKPLTSAGLNIPA